jgi:hypothetical protein
MLATVLSFDSPPEARIISSYIVRATRERVLSWYRAQLTAGGWREGISLPARSPQGATQVFHRGRESFSVEFVDGGQAIALLDIGTSRHRLRGDETYLKLDYRIPVRRRPAPRPES